MRPLRGKCSDGMIAVDTNVVVRLLTADHASQTAAASELLGSQPFWIAKTVLLETEWVLRSLYGFDAASVHQAFSTLLGFDGVQVEDEQCVSSALSLTSNGIQFADAMHLSSRPPGAKFVSFDRTLVRRAQRAGAVDVHELVTK